MALPKEPRQKMINIMYLVLTALLALNVSAEVIEAFKTVDKSLVKSNVNLETGNNTLFESLKDKLTDPQVNKEKLAIWTANAGKAKDLSDGLNTYLEGLKKQLKEASGLTVENGVEKFKDDDLNASSRIMDNEKKGKELDDKLKEYRKAMLAIDSGIARKFDKIFPVEVDNSTDATTPSFRMMPTVAAVTLLSKYQNNVKNAENQVVTFCHDQVGKIKVVYNQFAAIVGQSSNYLMPGEKLKINAGVGAFSTEARPVITIGGSSIPVNAEGVAEKEFSVDGSGDKSVSVNVSYTTPDGKVESKPYTIKYTVGTPGGSAIMLDKMNAFYIGLENPITIGSPKGWDKTQVNSSGCTLSGSNGKRTVTVTTPGTASITISAEGTPPTTYQFRVLRVPDPVFKIGDGKPRQPTVSLKNQQFVRAELENFVYDTKFSITKATVYFSGAGFPSTQIGSINGNGLGGISGLLQRCQPGSSITFDAVTVTGPGGSRVIDGRTFTCY